MKRIIDGKTYNTDTATFICEVECRSSGKRDFNHHETSMYKSPKGQYFIAGEGGPSSMWARSCGQNSFSGGAGLRLIDQDEARGYAEDAHLDEAEMLAAGFLVEEG